MNLETRDPALRLTDFEYFALASILRNSTELEPPRLGEIKIIDRDYTGGGVVADIFFEGITIIPKRKYFGLCTFWVNEPDDGVQSYLWREDDSRVTLDIFTAGLAEYPDKIARYGLIE